MATSNLTLKLSTTIALVLSIYGNFKYAIGRSPVDDDPEKDPFFKVGFTPFTGNSLVVFIYWGVLHLQQILFVSKYYYTDGGVSLTDSTDGTTANTRANDKIAWHFTAFNVLQFVWVLLFSKGHYIWAEIFVILNLLQMAFFYVASKTHTQTSVVNYVLVHSTVTAMPLSWLFYTLFWNGAAMIGSNTLAARIVANVFIWNFLFVPLFYLVVYRDWAVGFSSTILTFALALGQLFTKIFALQWIFAFVISGSLLLSSIAVMSANFKRAGTADGETAPLIS